jgi:hypothetical protein
MRLVLCVDFRPAAACPKDKLVPLGRGLKPDEFAQGIVRLVLAPQSKAAARSHPLVDATPTAAYVICSSESWTAIMACWAASLPSAAYVSWTRSGVATSWPITFVGDARAQTA